MKKSSLITRFLFPPLPVRTDSTILVVAIIVTIAYSADVPWEPDAQPNDTLNISSSPEEGLPVIPVLLLLGNTSWPLAGECRPSRCGDKEADAGG